MFEPFGRQVRIMTMGAPRRVHRVMGQTKTYPCPLVPPPAPGAPPNAAYDVSVDPTLNCMRDARGNAVCSNGVYYPPGCPHTPPDSVFTPGISPDEIHNGILEAKVPAPRVAGTTGGSGTSGTSGGASLVAPVAVGGLIGAGILYYFMR